MRYLIATSREQRRRPMSLPGRAGFSLVELMAAMVILAVGIMATMAMQFSSLAAYSSSREVTGASEMARTVEQMIRAESRGYNVEQGGPGTAPAPFSDRTPLLAAAVSSGGNWSLPNGFERPISARFNEADTDDDGSRRFCVYVAGQEVVDDPGMMRIGIAVVYPAPNGQFPGGATAEDPSGRCPAPDTISLDEQDQQDLEVEGLRVTRLSTAISAMDI